MKIYGIGGFSEVGKNMTAIKVDDEIIILDMGLYLPAVLKYEEGDPRELTTKDLIKIGAIPDDEVLHKYKNQVKAIVLGHCHLDHIGAIPYILPKFDKLKIYGTALTLAFVKDRLEEFGMLDKVNLITFSAEDKLKIGSNFNLEFFRVNHNIFFFKQKTAYEMDG